MYTYSYVYMHAILMVSWTSKLGMLKNMYIYQEWRHSAGVALSL